MEQKLAPELAERTDHDSLDVTPLAKVKQKRTPKLADEAEYWRMFYLACLAYVTGPPRRIQLRWLEDMNRSSSKSRHNSIIR